MSQSQPVPNGTTASASDEVLSPRAAREARQLEMRKQMDMTRQMRNAIQQPVMPDQVIIGGRVIQPSLGSEPTPMARALGGITQAAQGFFGKKRDKTVNPSDIS